MQKKKVSGLLLPLLLLGMLTLAFNVQPVEASGTIYITPDGTVEGTDKIQRDGDVYTFADNIYDAVVVQKNNVVIDGAGRTLRGTSAYLSKGIDLSGRSNVTIRNMQIQLFYYGIFLDESSHNHISGNNITNNDRGIETKYSSYNTILRNSMANNWYGIRAYRSSRNTVSENNMTNNREIGFALGYSSYNTISGNNVKANNLDGIRLEHVSYSTISGNNVTNNLRGIWLYKSSRNTVSGNNVKANGNGIGLGPLSTYNTISRNSITNNGKGIYLLGTWGWVTDNTICENNLANNLYGIEVKDSPRNTIYHNNFVDNTRQVGSDYRSPNVWDDGYPSGGNYWSDHVTVDNYSGVNQDEPGSDGIVDEKYYIILYWNRDNYPLVEPWSPVVPATIVVAPDTLNIYSKGRWITAYIQLSEGYNADDVDAATILLNETIQPVLDPKYDFVTNSSEYLTDYDGDGVLERMVKFNRTEVISSIHDDLGIEYGDVVIEITGDLYDETPFEGTDTIKVLLPGDADDDGDVDSNDLYIFSRCHGMSVENPSYNPLADFNEDGHINSEDLLILSENYGKTAS